MTFRADTCINTGLFAQIDKTLTYRLESTVVKKLEASKYDFIFTWQTSS